MLPAYRKPDTCWQHHAALNGGMTHSQRPRTTTRRIRIRRIRVAGPLVVIAAIAAASAPSRRRPRPRKPITLDVLRSEHRGPRSQHRAVLGEADSAIPGGTTVFDDGTPGVANLDPALLGALREAATAAADDGVELVVDSGWRSPEYQEQHLRQAVSSTAPKRKPPVGGHPNTSAHVSGDAVDIGPSDATAWLSEHGADYGLCDLRQRALAPRTASRSRRSRLPSSVRRPDARSKDAAVTSRSERTGVNVITRLGQLAVDAQRRRTLAGVGQGRDTEFVTCRARGHRRHPFRGHELCMQSSGTGADPWTRCGNRR